MMIMPAGPSLTPSPIWMMHGVEPVLHLAPRKIRLSRENPDRRLQLCGVKSLQHAAVMFRRSLENLLLLVNGIKRSDPGAACEPKRGTAVHGSSRNP